MSYNHWLIAGVVFIALELVLPGGIAGALSLSTLMIALLIYLGWLTEFVVAIGIWLLLSTVCLFVARKFAKKFSPSQSSVANTDEDHALRGLVVAVTEKIGPGTPGRIMVRGTTWIAVITNTEQVVHVGGKVRLLTRDNIIWNVEPVLDPSLDPALATSTGVQS